MPSREITKSFVCKNCGCQGHGIQLQSYSDGEWHTENTVIPDGWTDFGGDDFYVCLCPRCSRDSTIRKKANNYRNNVEASRQKKAKDKKDGQYAAVGALITGLLSVIILPPALFGSMSIVPILIGLAFLALSVFFLKLALKRNLGCGIIALIVVFLPLILVFFVKVSSN
jgi:hypothetical protein